MNVVNITVIFPKDKWSHFCRRCGREVAEDHETCWACFSPLCDDCWDKHGHCGSQACESKAEGIRRSLNESED